MALTRRECAQARTVGLTLNRLDAKPVPVDQRGWWKPLARSVEQEPGQLRVGEYGRTRGTAPC